MNNTAIKRKDMTACALCLDAPCTNACGRTDPGKLLLSIWLGDQEAASLRLPEKSPCTGCDAPCEKACIMSGRVPVKELVTKLSDKIRPRGQVQLPSDEERLNCELCGVPLENPFIVASSVAASNYDMCARALEAGWGGVCFKTICSIDIREASPRFAAVKADNGTIAGFKNIEQLSEHTVDEDMAIIKRLKEEYPSKFIMASVMGQNEEEWASLSELCEKNGADAVELNFSCPNMQEEGLGSDIGQIPELVERFTRAAKRNTSVPVLAKLTPNVMSMSPAAEAAVRGGADGIAAINTIKSVMGVSPSSYVSSPDVSGRSAVGGYSGNAVRPVALRFISEMGRDPLLRGTHISGMGGIETWNDALEFILLGAGTVQAATSVMQYGYRIIDHLKSGLNYFLMRNGIASVKDIIGAGLEFIDDTTDSLDRNTVQFPMFDERKCIGCGRCVISCSDGGHQALSFEGRRPKLNGSKCVGCQLCVLVCPADAVYPGSKRIKKL